MTTLLLNCNDILILVVDKYDMMKRNKHKGDLSGGKHVKTIKST